MIVFPGMDSLEFLATEFFNGLIDRPGSPPVPGPGSQSRLRLPGVRPRAPPVNPASARYNRSETHKPLSASLSPVPHRPGMSGSCSPSAHLSLTFRGQGVESGIAAEVRSAHVPRGMSTWASERWRSRYARMNPLDLRQFPRLLPDRPRLSGREYWLSGRLMHSPPGTGSDPRCPIEI